MNAAGPNAAHAARPSRSAHTGVPRATMPISSVDWKSARGWVRTARRARRSTGARRTRATASAGSPAIRQSRSTLVLNDFSAARVVPCETGGKKLVASGPFPAGAVLFRFSGELSPVNIGDRSLQVGRAAHLLSVPPEEPWVYLNHSFEPTVSLTVDPVTPVATARTTGDLVDGAALTIDYTRHEWEMAGDGFVCSESGRRVRGFKHLSASEREAALPRAAPHIREMAGE